MGFLHDMNLTYIFKYSKVWVIYMNIRLRSMSMVDDDEILISGYTSTLEAAGKVKLQVVITLICQQ